MPVPTRRTLLTRFAAEAGALAGEAADRHSTADRAFRAYAPRLDALRGVGPRTLERLRAVFVAAYEDARLEQWAADSLRRAS